MRSKKKDQTRHVQKRAIERFGINLSEAQQQALIRQIQQGNAKFVIKQSNRITIFDVEHEGNTIRVVYDKDRKSLATVLTTDMNPVGQI